MVEKVIKSDAEWRAELSDMAYKVLRKHGTERAGTHDNFAKDPGTFMCVGCGAPLFEQATKFESGTGWPSFYAPLDPEMVGEKVDRSFFMRRTERIGDLNYQVQDLLGRQRLLLDSRLEGLALQVFHADEAPALVLSELVNDANVRVIQRRCSAGFPQEAGVGLRTVEVLLGEEFQRDRAVE